MKQLFQRLIVFFIGLPFLIILILFLPQFNYLAFNCVVITVSILGALEFQNFLRQKNICVFPIEAAILGGLSPVAAAGAVCFNFGFLVIPGTLILGALWLLVSQIFSSDEKLDLSVNRSAAGFSVLIYPGSFMAWIIPLSLFPKPHIVISVFLLMTYLNDAAAWAAGICLGKKNRGIIPASPNKSVAGFAGGLLASVAIGVIAALVLPGAFNSSPMPGPLAGAILGLIVGAAATLGDLGESALKRSAGLKDSGFIIPGRGGILDSIDSLAAAAPVYYIFYRILFG
ncbi:MAG: phosphatidate cytidylyltransferase [Treponema sp.]|jgi:phosphatidate cytidylyltransferase|nr:phosphatidate cytidylyltransferase [Treponema sp.]